MDGSASKHLPVLLYAVLFHRENGGPAKAGHHFSRDGIFVYQIILAPNTEELTA